MKLVADDINLVGPSAQKALLAPVDIELQTAWEVTLPPLRAGQMCGLLPGQLLSCRPA